MIKTSEDKVVPPKIKGTEITVRKVAKLFEQVEDSNRLDTILYESWELTEEQVEEAIKYYNAHTEEIEEIERNREEMLKKTAE